MRLETQLTILFLLARLYLSLAHPDKQEPFLNIWAIKINGNANDARQIAHHHGYDLVEEVNRR